MRLPGSTLSGAESPLQPAAAGLPPDRSPRPKSSAGATPKLKIKIKLAGQARRVVHVVDSSRTLVARFTVQPGAQFPWHSHAGPVIVNVTTGELVYVGGDDCVERPYGAGSAFVDPGPDHTHTAVNATNEPTILVATFLEAPPEGPLVIPAQPPGDCTG